MCSKQQQAIRACIQQAVYGGNKQCSKQYAAVAARSIASSSSSSASSPTRTHSNHQHHTTTAVCSFGTAVAVHYCIFCCIPGIACGNHQQTQLAAVALILLFLFVVAEYALYSIDLYVHTRTCIRTAVYVLKLYFNNLCAPTTCSNTAAMLY